MIAIFQDTKRRSAHDRFQRWRKEHSMGFFVNRRTESAGLIHRTNCNNHHGTTQWSDEREGASLTAKMKVCSDSVAQLQRWAISNHLAVTKCEHCNPRDPQTSRIEFSMGEVYTRQDIHNQLGGSIVSYLPTVEGRVVCACLNKDINPDAPHIILVGEGRGIESAGAVLAAQKGLVPVFLKRSTNAWIYVGDFGVERSTQARSDIARHAKGGGSGVTRIIYLQPGRLIQDTRSTKLSHRSRRVQPTADPFLLEERTNEALKAPTILKPLGQPQPKRIQTNAAVYERDPNVRAFVLRRAVGKCECCCSGAPFIDLGDQPFLEVHHIQPLSEQGTDTVENAAAVCPNCHRECHRGKKSKALRIKLLKVAKASPDFL